MSARFLALAAVLSACTVASPATVGGQSISDLLDSIRQGGGWVRIPVEMGAGTLVTTALPTLGLRISGCAQVWGGHSGEWDINARDTQGRGRLAVRTRVGEPVPFSYDTGLLAQLAISVTWSEPRDTTLLLWVGLDGPVHSGAAACEPVYGGVEEGHGTRGHGNQAALPARRTPSMLMRPSP